MAPAPDSPPAPQPNVLARRWNRPTRCSCDKVPHRTEDSARNAPSLPSGQDTPFRVYRCPGSRVWHVTTRGFHPRSLKSCARVTAYYLLRHGTVSVEHLIDTFQEWGVWAAAGHGSPDRERQRKRLGKSLRDMTVLGVVCRPDRGLVGPTVGSRDKLQRIIEVGLEEFAVESGTPLRVR